MKKISKPLKECMTNNMGLVGKCNLIKKILDYLDLGDDEQLYDLENPYCFQMFSKLYGGQSAERLFHSVRFVIGGNRFYCNPLDRTEKRTLKIRPISRENADTILYEYFDRLTNALELDFENGKWDDIDVNPRRVAINLSNAFYPVDFEKAMLVKPYIVSFIHSITVEADSKDEAIRIANESYDKLIQQYAPEIDVAEEW